MKIATPYYLIDESKLLDNLKIVSEVKDISGAKVLLALKCFSSYSVFPLLKEYLDGTTSSSLYEARLGYEEFGKETQGYCVGYTEEDIKSIRKYSDRIIFNSLSQLVRYHHLVKNKSIGIRVNSPVNYSKYDLANPGRPYSKLGVLVFDLLESLQYVDGLMFHFNCDNNDFENFQKNLKHIERDYKDFLFKVKWVSLGGGVLFASKSYPYVKFAKLLKKFSDKYGVQVYLEPGETIVHNAGELVTSVVDIFFNREHIAVVDASTEAHMLDSVVYKLSPDIEYPKSKGKYKYHIAGRSCLAGDVFGVYDFKQPIKIGDELRFANGIAYSIVKKTWFNGLSQPSILVKKIDGSIKVEKIFTYKDYKNSLS